MKSRLKRTLPVKFGSDFVEVIDGRSMLGRTIRERLAGLHQDLGGADSLSSQQHFLTVRAVWLDLLLANEEARIARGEGVDVHPYVALTNSLLAVCKTLGLKRQVKQMVLQDYLKLHARNEGETTS